MPQAMDGDLRHPRSGNEFAEPLRHAVGEYGSAGVGGEHPPVLVLPSIPQLAPLLVLPVLVFQEHHHGSSRDKQGAGGAGRLGRADIHALPREVIEGLPDGDCVLVQIHVLPAKAEKFLPPEPRQEVEGDNGPPAYRLVLQQLQEPPRICFLQEVCLMLAQAGLFRCVSGIDLDVPPLDRTAQDGGQRAVIGDHAGRGQRVRVGGQGKGPVGFHLHRLGNSVSRFLVDRLASQSLVDGGPADTGPPGERGQGPALGPDLRLKVDLADGGGAAPDTALLKVQIEAVDMAGAEIGQADVADSLIDSAEIFCVSGNSFGLQVERGVFGHILLREVCKAHGAVGRGPA